MRRLRARVRSSASGLRSSSQHPRSTSVCRAASTRIRRMPRQRMKHFERPNAYLPRARSRTVPPSSACTKQPTHKRSRGRAFCGRECSLATKTSAISIDTRFLPKAFARCVVSPALGSYVHRRRRLEASISAPSSFVWSSMRAAGSRAQNWQQTSRPARSAKPSWRSSTAGALRRLVTRPRVVSRPRFWFLLWRL